MIPEFEHFSKQITDIYNSCKSNEAGQVSTYYYVFIIQKNFAPKKLTTKIAHTQNLNLKVYIFFKKKRL